MNFSNVKEWTINEGSVIRVTDSLNRVIWEKEQPVLKDYFYVGNASGQDNTISITDRYTIGTANPIEVFKSNDGINWSSMGTTSATAITATIPANGKLYLKATVDRWRTNKITSNGNINVGGNIMSLLYGDNFETQTSFSSDYSFGSFFSQNTKLVSAADLVLPATTLTENCYYRMFYGCTSLTTAPALPATTLAQSCYDSMFSGCTSLTAAPTLPATTLTPYCYYRMFENCTSLTQAPVFPDAYTHRSCCSQMFLGCTSLTTAHTLPASANVDSYSAMFKNCTSLTQAPALPAKSLSVSCYSAMFQGCTNLNSVTIYANTISGDSLDNWLDGVSSTGDFYNLGRATYPRGVSGIPTGWTVHTSL